MKSKRFMVSIGILLYVALSLTDRFFYQIPDCVYIPLAILGFVITIAGVALDKKKDKEQSDFR